MIKMSFLILMLALSACSDFSKEPKAPTQSPVETSAGENPFANGKTPNPNVEAYSDRNFLLNVGLNLIVPWTQEFSRETQRLDFAIEDLCSAATSDSLEPAREQWVRTARSWAKLEAVNFGPARDLSDYITSNVHSWPNDSLCGVDTLVAESSEAGRVDGRIIFSRKGLPALEWLLHAPLDVTACVRQTPQLQAWLSQEPAKRQQDRCQVMRYLVQDLRTHAQNLENRWSVQQGNYTKTWAVDVGSQTRASLNLMSDGLFHIEKVKDRKLAVPLGLVPQCPKTLCPEMVEAPSSGAGLWLVFENLKALQSVFYGHPLKGEAEASVGTGAYGIDDALLKRNRRPLALRMARELDAAVRLAESAAQRGAFATQIQQIESSTCGELCELHNAVRELGRTMKTEFLSVLDLRPPRVIEGDND